MKEMVELVDGIPIKYFFKKKKYDTKHLIVVFSGFGGESEFTYDFLNAFQHLRANIVWIKDDFFGHCSYYLAHNNSFQIENSVIQFILKLMNQLGIEKQETTLVGASKGGSAALYFGIKYDFINIISSVPQLLIGDYVTSGWHTVGKHMLGDTGKKEVFDNLIINQMINDISLNKNIYLLTSEVDNQYKKHIAPYLKYFYKYRNFNALFSESILVREHNQITGHHIDVIIGILSMLSANIAPVLGCKSLYGDSKDNHIDHSLENIIDLKDIKIKGSRLFLDGVGIVRGKEAKDYDQINYNLVLSNTSNEDITLKIAKGNKSYLTKEYYDGAFCIYDKCWFTTYKYEGVDLSNIPCGKYQLFLEIIFEDYQVKEALTYNNAMIDSDKLCLVFEYQKLYLIVK